MLRIQQLKLTLVEDQGVLRKKIMKLLHISENDLINYHIFKESVDARKEHEVCITYCVDCHVTNENAILKRNIKGVSKSPDIRYRMPTKGMKKMKHRPIIVGFGPAGMFSALLFAQMGYCPLVFERGGCVEDRIKSVAAFWQTGILDPRSNVQFGEGGAGTFSDGKLTSRSKDTRVHKVLQELVKFGAPEEILYQAHPHIGTDLLRKVVRNMRKEILRLGGMVVFDTFVEDIEIVDGRINGVVANHKRYPCERLILAIGHSARDTLYMLMDKGIAMQAKAFAIGARIEHPQALINQAQYKSNVGHKRLQPAQYRLTHTASNGRGVYTFCMCPGGSVVPSTSQEYGVVVNGMSEHARDKENANSALLVQIHRDDFDNDPKKGIVLQETLEKKAYVGAGSTYQAPAQLVQDFLACIPSTKLGKVTPSYALGVCLCNLHDILPDFVCRAMQEGIQYFDKKLKGFALEDAILTGVETRSSSPVRIQRNKEDYVSINVEGLYPCGEGAGYAGGIVSAAVDGLRCAESIISMVDFIKEETKDCDG